MPGRDGIGPMGRGSMTGRGMGFCTGVNAGRTSVGLGREMGKGLRLGMGFGLNEVYLYVKTQKMEKSLLSAGEQPLWTAKQAEWRQ